VNTPNATPTFAFGSGKFFFVKEQIVEKAKHKFEKHREGRP
jgi:hypothetical protein